MNAISKVSKVTAALVLVSAAAYGQQPPDVVNSDTYGNTAMGTDSLLNNQTSQCATVGPPYCGNGNTAAGAYSLFQNTFGLGNSGFGSGAMYNNITGDFNSSFGAGTLYNNTTGTLNTAFGASALASNTGGNFNTASGGYALAGNTTGINNTASGVKALFSNTSGGSNAGSGYQALNSNTTGSNNTATGVGALYSNAEGNDNTASGYQALRYSTGSNNIAVGYQAGVKVTTGSNNVDIANRGEASDGVAADSGVIRIGEQTPTAHQTSTYIAGIYDNTSVAGLPVVIDSHGQLGTTSSSERFKTAIAPMGSNTTKLQQLRPVTFQYKADPKGTLRYGLIAEEVAKVYPELVVRDNNGRIDGVRYDELAPMLLNEVQQQATEIRDLKKLIVQMQAGLLKLQSNDQVVAQR